MRKISIAKALRNRKTLANNIATSRNRASNNAVSNKEEKTDFNVSECIESFLNYQQDLRSLKTAIAIRTSSTMVEIPLNTPIPEAGKKVSLYQAILIRDDLKAQKQFFDSMVNIRCCNETRWRGDQQEVIEKIRNFDFDETIALVDKIQESIDTVDAIIQYADNTENL